MIDNDIIEQLLVTAHDKQKQNDVVRGELYDVIRNLKSIKLTDNGNGLLELPLDTQLNTIITEERRQEIYDLCVSSQCLL